MKRFVIVLCTVLLVSGFAFADVTWGAWGRMMFSLAQNTDDVLGGKVDADNNYVSMGPSWAAGGRVGIGVHGTSDNFGFDLDINSSGAGIAIGDNARVWCKFNDMFKLTLGQLKGDTLRGKFGDLLFVGGQGEDAIFTRFQPNAGFLAEVTPVTGVYIAAAADAKKGAAFVNKLKDVYSSIQIGAGYTIPDIGLARVQYIGAPAVENGLPESTNDNQKIEAAFQLTAVKNLNVDIGFKYLMGITDKDPAKTPNMNVAAAASYNLDALGLLARVGANLGNSADTQLPVSAQVTYKAMEKVTVGVQFASGDLLAKSDVMSMSVAPFVEMGFSNGSVDLGFVAVTNQAPLTGTTKALAWRIPLVLTYSF